MPRGIVYENDYIVDGKFSTRLTPNFRLKEYALPHGRLFVHRELPAAIQLLRTELGQSVSIASLKPRSGLGHDRAGRFAWLKAKPAEEMDAAASKLLRNGFLAVSERRGNRLYVEIPDPENLPPVKPDLALEHAVLVTAGFETSGDPYLQVTGNFDGAGLSFGPLQVNFGTGTLPKLFKRFEVANEKALRRCFDDDYVAWRRVLKSSRSKQVAWADGLSTGSRKAGFAQPWKGYLQAVGSVPRFRREMLGYAYDVYGRKLIVALSWLRGLSPIDIDNFRCLAALYDLCVQQGSLNRAHDVIRREVQRKQPADQFELVRIAVEERGRKANSRWRADAISRRLMILERQPVRVVESGQTASRDNRMAYLLRNSPVKSVDRYLI